ncbi:hypothetical protein ODR13_24620, partial [Escherichia coli]|nr:hypothetical protein [Escherichia coli]
MEYFMKGKSALTLLLAGIFSCGTCQATGAEVTSESVFNILNSTGAATDKSYLSLNPDKYPKEGANKRGNSSRLTQSFHFFMFEPIFSPVNALN